MELHIPYSLSINKNLRPKDDSEAVIVTYEDGCVCINSENGGVSIALSDEEVLAIVRLFVNQAEA